MTESLVFQWRLWTQMITCLPKLRRSFPAGKQTMNIFFCEKSNTNFDDTHFRNIQSALRDNRYPAHNADISILNAEITKSEIEKSILRANLGKAAGLDNIPAEILRNPVCVELLYNIIRYCFNTGTVPNDWNTGLIKPIPKFDGKDPRDPLRYGGITLISIPCKIYADILIITI